MLNGALTKASKLQGFDEPETSYAHVLNRFGDTTDNDAHTKALAELGIESYFSCTLSAADIVRSLLANIPVVAEAAL